jgi:hypothetical protein
MGWFREWRRLGRERQVARLREVIGDRCPIPNPPGYVYYDALGHLAVTEPLNAGKLEEDRWGYNRDKPRPRNPMLAMG